MIHTSEGAAKIDTHSRIAPSITHTLPELIHCFTRSSNSRRWSCNSPKVNSHCWLTHWSYQQHVAQMALICYHEDNPRQLLGYPLPLLRHCDKPSYWLVGLKVGPISCRKQHVQQQTGRVPTISLFKQWWSQLFSNDYFYISQTRDTSLGNNKCQTIELRQQKPL